jgi:hypothetical protein
MGLPGMVATFGHLPFALVKPILGRLPSSAGNNLHVLLSSSTIDYGLLVIPSSNIRMSPMTCGKCGALNSNSRSFCKSCGRPLWPTLTPKVHASPYLATGQGRSVASAQPTRTASDLPEIEFSRLYGVRGWLLFFCIVLTVVQPLGTAVEVIGSKSLPMIILNIGFAALCIYTGVCLWRIAPKSLEWLEVFLVARLAMAGLSFVSAIYSKLPPLGHDFSINPYLQSGVTNLYGVIIWWAYFKKSKRVLTTYGRNL